MSQRKITCQYCRGDAPLVDSSVVYGKSYGPIYYCAPCGAYVGVHKKTLQPLGTVANAELRFWRKQAHAAFDPLWQGKRMPRGKAYAKLAKELNVSVIHIGANAFACTEF